MVFDLLRKRRFSMIFGAVFYKRRFSRSVYINFFIFRWILIYENLNEF